MVVPTNEKIVLQQQTAHADAVALFTQNGWASVVDSTADFLNSAQLSPFVRVLLEMMAFSGSLCSRSVCIQYSKLVAVKTTGTRVKINAIWWNIKINVHKLAHVCGYELPTNLLNFTHPVKSKRYYQNFMLCGVGKKISMIYINDIYHDSIIIFSSENITIFLIFSKYQLLLLLFTYFSNSCISNTNCPSP